MKIRTKKYNYLYRRKHNKKQTQKQKYERKAQFRKLGLTNGKRKEKLK